MNDTAGSDRQRRSVSDTTSDRRDVQSIRILCLFLTSGRTYTFRNVVILSDNETTIAFTYIAMSDDLPKRATFSKAHVAGVSRTT